MIFSPTQIQKRESITFDSFMIFSPTQIQKREAFYQRKTKKSEEYFLVFFRFQQYDIKDKWERMDSNHRS